MKRLFTLSILLLMALGIFAQMPKGFSYQAVVRNSNGKLVDNKQVGVRFSILQGSAEGSAVYTETQTLTTNANGLLTVAIGSGAGFDAIDWASGSYFLKSEIDPNGGTDYTITGVSQLLSVPYAMHAKTAESATESDPVFGAWDKTTGISINKSQISDLGAYVATETDPTFTAWDKTTGISITEGQISDLKPYLTAEIDPAFTAWDKTTGISITESQISDLKNYLTAEVDPTYTATFSIVNPQEGDLLRYDATAGKWVRFTHDFAMGGHTHSAATTTENGFMSAVDKTKLDGLENADGSETKLTAGSNVTITGSGTSASPYLINASCGSHYIGEEYLGGIIFYLYIGSDGEQHGLIVSKSEGAELWQTKSVTGATRSWDGAYNMSLMTNDRAKKWITTNFSAEWYFPSLDEVSILWHNRFHVNKALNDAGATLLSHLPYWTSTEYDAENAYFFNFREGYSNTGLKDYTTGRVRAVRAF